MKDKILANWIYIQTLFDINGDCWVGAFAVVFLVRLVGPVMGFPPLTYAESIVWSATIGSLAYSKKGAK